MTDSCKHVVKIKTSIQLGILSPERWHCKVCSTTESVWACLSCSNFACGRYISEHALQHFQTTGHPLCIEVNEKFVFCYICDDFVLNDNAPGDIKLLRMALDAVTAQNFEELSKQKRGRRILRYHMRDCKRITRRLLKADDVQTAVARHRFSRLSWALRLWWSRYIEKKTISDTASKLRAASGKRTVPLNVSSAFTGLRNLGNTCYMNSVLQVLRHTASFANFILSHSPSEVLPHSRKRRAVMNSDNAEASEPPLKRPSLCPPFASTSSPSQNHTKTHSSASVSFSSNLTTSSPCTSVGYNSYPQAPHMICSSDRAKENTKNERTPVHESSDGAGAGGGGLNGGRCAVARVEDAQTSFTTTSNTTDGPPVTSRCLYEELYGMFRTLWSGQRTVISPSSLLYTIWTTLPSFKGYRQQDAQEFLSVFLDRLQSELHGNSCTVSVNSRDFVNRTFQGHCVSHVRCSECNVVACTEEPFSELSLALPLACYTGDANECELMDLLHKFFSPTPIDGASYACRQCNRTLGSGTKVTKPDPTSNVRDSFKSCMSTPKQPTSFRMDKLVSVTLSRLNSPPTDSQPFSSYGMKARHFSTSQTVSALSTSTSSSSSSSSSLSSAASPSLSSTLDELDDFSTSTMGSTVPLNSTATTTATSRTTMASATMAPTMPVAITRPEPVEEPRPQLTSATQTIRLTRLPRVLRLHIKRFRWIGRQREKVGCHVSFPLILDLTDFMLNSTDRAECGGPHLRDIHSPSHVGQVNQNTSFIKTDGPIRMPHLPDGSTSNSVPRRFLYHLTGVIVHHGRGFQSGHYTAYCLNDQPECWLNCNDANVTLCDFSEVAAAQAYLLFYSELMPTAPYPTWFNELNQSADLKRSQSNLSLGRLSQDSTTSVSASATSTVVVSKTDCSMKRTASTPSHTLQLRSAQSKRSGVFHSMTTSSQVATDNEQRSEHKTASEVTAGGGKSRLSTKRSATPNVSF